MQFDFSTEKETIDAVITLRLQGEYCSKVKKLFFCRPGERLWQSSTEIVAEGNEIKRAVEVSKSSISL